MTQKELIQRERIALREMRMLLTDTIEGALTGALKRLDDWEMRIEKEALTNGKVSFPEDPAKPAEEPPVEAELVAPSLIRPPCPGGPAAVFTAEDNVEGGRA